MRTRLVGHLTRVRLAALGALLAALSATALATQLVSDAGGYKATDQTVFSFIDVSEGGATVLTGTDDDKVALTLPFPFTFFGHAYPMVCVSSNGAAYFIDAEPECGTIGNDFANVDLSAAASPNDRPGIFPLWSDLALPGAGTGVAYQTQGDAPHRKFVLQWNNAYPLLKEGGASSAPVTFEAILLEENNQILFQYNRVDLGADPASNGRRATVGIRNHGALVALDGGGPNPTFGQQIAWSFNSSVLADRKAILFTSGKSTPVVTATGGTFPYTGSSHAGSGAAYGTGGLSDVLSPAVTLSYAGVPPTAYGPNATAPTLGGTYEVTANFAGNADYTAGSRTAPLTITVGSQTITITSTAPSAAKVGGTYAAAATSSAALTPVTFSSLTTETCASGGTNGATISFIGAGICQVAADQAGNANYDPAAQQTQSFSVGKGAQTISFTSLAPGAPSGPAAATVGGPTYAVSATGGASGNPVTFTSQTTGVCTVGGNGFTVSFIAVGQCTVAANQLGDANYDPAAQQTQGFTVGKGAQTISFTSLAPGAPSGPAAATVGGPTYTVSATGGASGNAVTFSSLTTLVCTSGGINGSTISFVAEGNCQVAANQLGNTNYNAAPQQAQNFTVGAGGTQTITISSLAPGAPSGPAAATVGGPAYTIAATGGASGNPVTFSSLTTGVCTSGGINGATISFIALGTCQVAADQAGNGAYTAAAQQTQSFAVGKGTQTISFTSLAPGAPSGPSAATVGGTYTAAATSSAALTPVTFSSLTPGVCTSGGPNGATISFIAVGDCQVAADQAGNGTYNAAPQVTQGPFSVGKGAQTISFTSTAPAAATVGGPTYTAAATSSAVLTPVTFTSQTPLVCTASGTNGSTISFIGAGTCTVAANQAGNTNYGAAPQATQSFTVGKGTQTITFTSTAPVAATVGGPTYTASATSSASLTPVTFSSLTTLACTASGTNGSTISFIGAGTCTVAADQLGNANYNAAPQQTQSFSVATASVGAATTTTVASNHNPAALGQVVTITATVLRTSNGTAVTGGTVTFKEGDTVLSGPTSVGRRETSGKVSFTISTLPAGSHTITVLYSGIPGVFAPSSATLLQVVNKGATKTAVASSRNPSKVGVGVGVTITATVTSGGVPVKEGSVTFKEGATVPAGPINLNASGTASFLKSNLTVGTHTITAVYSGSSNYQTSSASVDQTVRK